MAWSLLSLLGWPQRCVTASEQDPLLWLNKANLNFPYKPEAEPGAPQEAFPNWVS